MVPFLPQFAIVRLGQIGSVGAQITNAGAFSSTLGPYTYFVVEHRDTIIYVICPL